MAYSVRGTRVVRGARHEGDAVRICLFLGVALAVAGGALPLAGDGGECHGSVREDSRPFAEGAVRGNQQAATPMSRGDQLKERAGLGLVPIDVAQVTEDDQMVLVALVDGAL